MILLILQLITILIVARVCAILFRSVGQPMVVGEMIAGILLGKSVFAVVWPEGFSALFPEQSMPALFLVSQTGLILFMFIVGLHLRISDVKNHAAAAFAIASGSIALPFLFGALVALGLYSNYGPAGHGILPFSMFMGIAMCITAFPVLVRIIQERRMMDSPLGIMALTCAAIADIVAWCLLAAIIGFSKSGGIHHYFLILAFVLGVVAPRKLFSRVPIHKIEPICRVFLLPAYFAYTGLRLEARYLDSLEAWLICAGIVGLAIAGKMFGAGIAARWSGMKWRESFALGALMNTRGLMELVVLNIGYDLGILTPAIFTMMVIMALVTTALTGPLLPILAGESWNSQKRA